MPFFGFSRTSSLRQKKSKNKEMVEKLKKCDDLQLHRTVSCSVARFPGRVEEKEENCDKKKDLENNEKDVLMTSEGKAIGPSFCRQEINGRLKTEEEGENDNISHSSKLEEKLPTQDSKKYTLKPDKSIKQHNDNEILLDDSLEADEKKSVRDRRRKIPITTINRRSQHFEDNPIDVLGKTRNRKSRNFEEDIEKSRQDPLKRFEYLRNGKATSVMIRATPNAVRWDQINRVQYRFQALNFHSDVLEALIHNSPPLSRREHNAAAKANFQKNLLRDLDNNNNGSLSSDDESDANNNSMDDKNIKIPSLSRQVKAIRRTNSCDPNHEFERKGSVVQVSPKDDTSDYNSDEEVFHARSDSDFENVNYNTTICHVKTGQIQETAQIQVTSCNNPDDRTKINNENIHLLTNPSTYERDALRKSSSAPPSTKVSTVTPTAGINERFKSEIDNLDYFDNEELKSKSKEELVELVRSLQRELETTKHQSYQRQHSPPHSPTHSRFATKKCCSRQQSINEEAEEKENSTTDLLPNVSSLIHNFEQRNHTEEEGLRRSNTLPLRKRKPRR